MNKKQFKTLGKAQPFFRRFEDYTVSIICAGLLGAVLFFAFCIFIVVINAFIWDDWYIDISAKGIKNMQLFWQDHSSLLSSFFYSITLFVACHNLMKYIDVETSRSLSEIRAKLNEEPKKLIHNHFLNPNDKEDIKASLGGFIDGLVSKDGKVDFTAVEVYDYLGTLELGAIMLHRGLITEKEFFDQFGYRYIYIGRSELMKLIEHDAQYYKPLLYAMEVARKHNKPSGSLVTKLEEKGTNQPNPLPEVKPSCQINDKSKIKITKKNKKKRKNKRK